MPYFTDRSLYYQWNWRNSLRRHWWCCGYCWKRWYWRGSGGKRGSLGKDSFLGLRTSDLSSLDLSKLLSRTQFLISCSLSMNGCGIDLYSLADTRVNSFLFISCSLIKRLSLSLSTPIWNLPYAVPVGGFNGKTKVSVNQFIWLHLTINSRQIWNCPFIVLNLGN